MKSEGKILLTGAAGFIGSHTCERLLAQGYEVIGIDNFDPYYPRAYKEDNLITALSHPAFSFIEVDICNAKDLEEKLPIDIDSIIHLAAKAGVRNSIENPEAYFDVNVNGTINLLEFAQKNLIRKFIFSSSSSVYGINDELPWHEEIHDLKPISPYASSKIAAEVIGHTYSQIYPIQFIGLRLFTVYGPRQRPDLAIHKFIQKINKGEGIELYGDGSTSRDYTYVDDIVNGIVSALLFDKENYAIFNLGSNTPYALTELIEAIENVMDKKAQVQHIEMQEGDVPKTYADINKAKKDLNYTVSVSLEEGIRSFMKWKNRVR